MFNNYTITKTNHHLSDAVKCIHGTINDGEYFWSEGPTLTQRLFKLGQHGMIEVTAGEGLATDSGQGGAKVGEQG